VFSAKELEKLKIMNTAEFPDEKTVVKNVAYVRKV
jgi:hypothetical protein